jgi:aromatase
LLAHSYRAVDADPAKLDWIDRAVEHNSGSELAALKAAAERPRDDLLISFTDTVQIRGAGRDVYDFINDAGRWTERLPHVSRAVVREDKPGLQLLEMDTRAPDGAVHSTTSVRVCFPRSRIVYKQISLPPLLSLHTGCWLIEETAAGVAASSQHTAIIRPEAIGPVLGPDADVAAARTFVREALSGNSLATLKHAAAHAADTAGRSLLGG